MPALARSLRGVVQPLHLLQAGAPGSLVAQVSSLGPAASQCLKPPGILCACKCVL